ncbi:TIR domain-containing protein [Salegentibacter sp. 24]|uniref:toll/interleukin-1 receptor domain-containing protein n=1 Tax=Salegentibacter sp. 24 TaxID=2183986 RepID=UPI00105D83E3|nr:TIR domain-containing protein [Salegentibacter sp. 24]TDN93394.1 TIR domain-containing protein [Salegentibacter sp. 24]
MQIDSLLIRDESKGMNEIKKFISLHKLQIRRIKAETFLNTSILYQKIDGKWDIHYYNYIRRRGMAIPYLYLALTSILRREKTWFETINPIKLDEFNQKIIIESLGRDKINLDSAPKFRRDYMQGFYLAFEISKLLEDNLITPKDAFMLFTDSELLIEHAGYYAALKRAGAKKEAKKIADFMWEADQEVFLKTGERINDCLEMNKIRYEDFFYVQQNHFPFLKTINFEEKFRAMKEKNDHELEFDIAISFAGQDREIAEKLATSLKNRGFDVFYDNFEKSKMWGKDLYEYLSTIYSTKAKYCVILISDNYNKKRWTRLERKAAQSRAFEEENEYILPLRIDDSSVPGILSTTGYLDYNTISETEIIETLIDKINNYGS